MASNSHRYTKGGLFLIQESQTDDIFIPEEFSEEQKMMAQACEDFLIKEIDPQIEVIENPKDGGKQMGELIEKAGALGLLAVSVPTSYEGLGMDFNSSLLVSDKVGRGHSFAVALSAHSGIGTLPIQYYGNEAQKKKYLPKLATGEWKACYCLTEPDSGSDANSGKTKAVLSDDQKHYIINGQKMWITNAGFADIFIVFAKIDNDDNLSAFIIEKSFEGISMNEPEHKMGIKGSDTRQVFFNDCKVPVENLLSERGNGFKIAVNILNIGRIKLAAATIGSSKGALNNAIQYANERKQFGVTIADFGAIQYKIAEAASRIFASESATYRVGQHIEDAIKAYSENGMDEAQAKLESFKQFAIECAIMKVHGSEMLDYVVDEVVQIYGGMGYSADAPAEMFYRDSRINRIFEGTNEINRMLLVGTVIKRALKGELALMEPAQKVAKELLEIPGFDNTSDTELFAEEFKSLASFKKAILMVAGAAVQKLGEKIQEEQEIMMHVADMMIEVFVTESVLLRVKKLAQNNTDIDHQKNMALIYFYEASEKINKSGKDAILSFAQGDEQKIMLMGLKRFTKIPLINPKAIRRSIAQKLIKKNEYI